MLVTQSRVLHVDDYFVKGQGYDVINCSPQRHCIMTTSLELKDITCSEALFRLYVSYFLN